MRVRLTVPTPPGFVYTRTLNSHGWCGLLPFHVDERERLHGVVARPERGALAYRLAPRSGCVAVATARPVSDADRRLLRSTTRRVLNLDLDLSGFHAQVSHVDGMQWIAATDSGRLLRCASLFEDVVKLILTTHCSWAFTTRMVRAMVDCYGAATPEGTRAFPDARAIAAAGAQQLRQRVRAGYRAPLVARLARQVADGSTEPDAWEHDTRDPQELRRELLTLPGVGPYVAENVLRFLGRPAGLGLDSWLRAKYARVYHGGRRVTDRTIARRYAKLGAWGGLALWCEMTRDWFEADDPEARCSALQ
jgi:N-glycosylase/DNA lyase